MSSNEPYIIGDVEIAIYIPTRYRSGAPIPPDVLDLQTSHCREGLTELFGGSTGVDPTQYIGSFKHDDDRVVDEAIIRVWTKVKDDDLTSEKRKSEIAKICESLARDLDQQSIAVEWGEQLISFSSKEKALRFKTVPFSTLTLYYQRQLAIIAMTRVRSAARIPELLVLDQWKEGPPEAICGVAWAKIVAHKGLRKVVILEEPLTREKQKTLETELAQGDLVFGRLGSEAICVWMKWGDSLRGGRELTQRKDERRISRNKLQLCLSILGSKSVERLQDVIDREAVTANFYRTYRKLGERIENVLIKHGLPHPAAALENQMLLGRLMFLRFLEQKGWLDGEQNYLAKRFRQKKGPYFSTVLEPLFYEVLDTPPDKRRAHKDIPYINAGLFRRSSKKGYELPDSLFDPDVKDSVIDIMRRNDFALEEFSGNEEISVNPAVLGFVLESICAEQEIKSKGIHFTPPVISGVLAEEAILGRLSDLVNVSKKDLAAFGRGRIDAVDVEAAQHIQKTLSQLRIIDPAVGSGSLLLSALEFLMRIFGNCCQRLGQPLIKGEHVWSETMRRFIRDSLFGVDIDPLAPEIAKLRLWLSLAAGEKNPRPLPDLEYNLKCGDSLSKIDEIGAQEQLELEFDELQKSRNAFLVALGAYKKAEGEAAGRAGEALEEAEYRYYVSQLRAERKQGSLGAKYDPQKERAMPFRWGVHFADVFRGKNKGFDIVIANPPYVRIHNLRRLEEKILDDYEERFKTLSFGNKDLYLAFVEQALLLAGKEGRIAFIMPNFSRTASGRPLRDILSARGAVDTWVDFGDIQVFESSTNYVALLSATAKKRRRSTFLCIKPRKEAWPPEQSAPWLTESPSGKVSSGDIWRTLSTEEAKFTTALERNAIPLGDIARSIGVGVQTSADEVFLLNKVMKSAGRSTTVHSDYLGKDLEVESAALRRCAKGSKHIKPYQVADDTYILWPYSRDGVPMDGHHLKSRFPLAWSYLERCRKRLQARDLPKNKYADRWWQFGRAQGLDLCTSPKILVPSILKSGTAFYDGSGEIAYTASGKGGGGAWGIVAKGPDVNPRWLLAVLNSSDIGRWLELEGDPKRDGWRGVDQALLRRLPVPRLKKGETERIVALTTEIEKRIADGQDWLHLQKELDAVIGKAFRG
ncbi:MAG: hypothetical protein FJY80_01215 [Candidatus Aminicenantes bacterium]|nr:hypothetical protein [Candidatus Aminicenantes bacterium]